MIDKKLVLAELRHRPDQPIDWKRVLKYCRLDSTDELENVLRLIVSEKPDKFPYIFWKKAALFLIKIADLPPSPMVLFPRNETGIIAHIIQQRHPGAKFTFYSDDVDIHAFLSYIYPEARIPGPSTLLQLANDETEKFDLIIGAIEEELDVGFVETSRDKNGESQQTNETLSSDSQPSHNKFPYNDQHFLSAISRLLKDGGKLISDRWLSDEPWYIGEPSYSHHSYDQEWLQHWRKLTDLAVEAVVEGVPCQRYLEFPSTIVVASKTPQSRIFSTQYSDDEKVQDTTVKNFLKKSQGKYVHVGFWSSFADYQSNAHLRHQESIQRMASMAKLSPVKLGDIIRDIKIGISPDADNVIYIKYFSAGDTYNTVLPFIASFPWQSTSSDDWIEIWLDPKKALSDYIIGFFINSDLGQRIYPDIIAKFDKEIPVVYVSKSSIENCTIYLPSIKVQTEAIREQTKLASLHSEIDELSSQLWLKPLLLDDISKRIKQINNEDTFSAWLDQLPFPLASILWSYHTQSRTEKESYEKLLHFFEACAEFFSIVHISALASNNDLWSEIESRIKSQLSDHHLRISTATFGTWITLLESMAKYTRKELNSDRRKQDILNAYKASKQTYVEQLSNKGIITVLKEAVAIRNRWQGHSGAVSDLKAQEIHDKLISLLQKIRGLITGIWECYELILPESGKYSQGEFLYKARRIVGNRTPFEQTEVSTVHPLEDNCLHLVSCETNDAIKLLPLLQVIPGPKTDVDACYFYNRIEKQTGEARYVSYHFDRDSDLTTKVNDEMMAALSLIEE